MVLDERIGQSNRDERLSGDAEPPSLLIDLAPQVDREVYVGTLNWAAGASRLAEVHVSRQIDTGVVQGVELVGGKRCNARLTTLFRH